MPFISSKQIITAYEGAVGAREQALVEGTALLPGVAGGAKILHTDARAQVASAELQNERLAVGGTVAFDILYSGDEDKRAAGTKAQYSFSHVIELKGAKPGMEIDIMPRVEAISATASGSKVTLRAVLTLEAHAFSADELEVLRDISGDDIHNLQKSISLCRTVSKGESKMLLEAEAGLPYTAEAEEVVFFTNSVRATNITSYDDRAAIEGELAVDAYCLVPLTDKPVARSHHVFPFETQVMMEGLAAGKHVEVDLEFTDAALSLMKNSEDAPATLRVEGVLSAKAVCEETETLSVLEDAFSTGKSTAELRIQLQLTASADVVEYVEFVIGAQETENDLPKDSAISIYFAKGGDTLWSLAKRYLTPIETLRKFNPQLGEKDAGGRLSAGERAILYRKGQA